MERQWLASFLNSEKFVYVALGLGISSAATVVATTILGIKETIRREAKNGEAVQLRRDIEIH